MFQLLFLQGLISILVSSPSRRRGVLIKSKRPCQVNVSYKGDLPLLLNSNARAWPMPDEQPVMRTDFGIFVVVDADVDAIGAEAEVL